MEKLLNTSQRFGSLSKGFHWTMALSLIAMLILGTVMEEMDRSSSIRPYLYTTHKSIGVLLFPIALAWFGLWIFQKKPDPLKEIPRPLHRFSKLVHGILMLGAVCMPLSGWAMSSAFSGKAISFFGLFSIPAIASYDPEFGRAMLGAHILISWILMGFGGLHILAALYHHFIRKNTILRRMLPFNHGMMTIKKKKKPSKVHHLGRK